LLEIIDQLSSPLGIDEHCSPVEWTPKVVTPKSEQAALSNLNATLLPGKGFSSSLKLATGP